MRVSRVFVFSGPLHLQLRFVNVVIDFFKTFFSLQGRAVASMRQDEFFRRAQQLPRLDFGFFENIVP